MAEKKVSPFYKPFKWLVRTVYRKFEIIGLENLPDDPSMIVGNHAQIHGPLAAELYFPGYRYIWCAGQMLHLKEVPAYAFQDFWSFKPKRTHWFYKLLSYLIAPLSVFIFRNAATIGVYRDSRGLSTFKNTLNALTDGANVIVFPEHNVKYNHIIYDFQDKFIDVARFYYRRTSRTLCFVPLYVAPNLRQCYLGKPIRFCPSNPTEQERQRICQYLMTEITEIACALPLHTVVPYRNIPKKDYPTNIPKEVPANEKAGG